MSSKATQMRAGLAQDGAIPLSCALYRERQRK
ncbi:MAG: hypothetical protein RIT40_168 [Planctomycetota bacterium]|jgi:hypothetical protein